MCKVLAFPVKHPHPQTIRATSADVISIPRHDMSPWLAAMFNGGMRYCVACGGTEGSSLTTDCPGLQMTPYIHLAVTCQTIDYEWKKGWIALPSRIKINF